MALTKMLQAEMPIFFTPPPVRGKYGRLFGGGGSAPPPPDPYATADAQGKANIEAAQKTAALNRYDQTTPFGSSTWSQDPANPDKWANNFTLDPHIQDLLDKYYTAAGQPTQSLDLTKLPAAGVASPLAALDISGAPTVSAHRVDAGTATSGKSADAYGQLTLQMADKLKKLYATDFNYDSLGAMPQASDSTRKAVEDAYYAREAARLDPRFSNEESALRSRLANQGITEGSEAYGKELDQFSRGKNDAYSSATNDAVTNSTSEMAKQFALQMAARQQGASELEKVRQAPTMEAQAAMGMYGNASGINTNNLRTQDQLYNSELAASQAAHDSYVREKTLEHSTAAADQSQNFNQANAARASALQEQLTSINLPQQQRTQMLNELMAIRSGSQVAPAGAGQVNVGASPVAQSIYNSYQGQQNAYNADVASSNAQLAAGAGLAGTAAMAAAIMF